MLLLAFSILLFLIFSYLKITPHQILHPSAYKIIYPSENPDLNLIKSAKICFSIAGFNCNIKLLKARINYLVQGVADYRICIYALDSTNTETLQELQAWKDPKVHLVPVVNTKKISRILRIGTIRFTLLKYTQTLGLDDTWNYVIYDSDHIGTISKVGLIDAIIRLKEKPELYAICASGTNSLFYGIHFLYDTFAYVNSKNIVGFKGKLHIFLNEYVPLISGFSGACVYRYIDIKDVKYELKPEICEHVVFHRSLKEKFDTKFGKACFMEMSKKLHIYVGLQPSNY